MRLFDSHIYVYTASDSITLIAVYSSWNSKSAPRGGTKIESIFAADKRARLEKKWIIDYETL